MKKLPPLERANVRGGTRDTIPEARAAHLVRRAAGRVRAPRARGSLSLHKAKVQLLAMAASKPKPVYCQCCGTLVADGHTHTAPDGTLKTPA